MCACVLPRILADSEKRLKETLWQERGHKKKAREAGGSEDRGMRFYDEWEHVGSGRNISKSLIYNISRR